MFFQSYLKEYIDKMRVLYFCNEYPPSITGGIGVFTREMAEELVKAGHSVFIYGQYNIDKAYYETINDVHIYRDKRYSGRLGFILNRVRSYIKIRAILNKYSIDILEVQDFHGLMGFFPRLNCKVIVRLHGSVIYFKTLLNKISFKDRVWFYFEKSNLNKADLILSVSDFTAKLTKSIFGLSKSVLTVHNGVKVTESYCEHYPSKSLQYIFAGSVIEKKGIVELISAWSIFSKNKDVILHVYGKDIEGLTERLKLHMENLHINNVFFHGAVHKDVLLLAIKDADFCVFPTKAEAFSLAPMEAMSMSKVVLYTDQTSASELVIHRSNGLLINECSEMSILESLEESFSLTGEEYKKISKNAYCTIVNNFNVEDKVIENIRIYQELLNQSDVK